MCVLLLLLIQFILLLGSLNWKKNMYLTKSLFWNYVPNYSKILPHQWKCHNVPTTTIPVHIKNQHHQICGIQFSYLYSFWYYWKFVSKNKTKKTHHEKWRKLQFKKFWLKSVQPYTYNLPMNIIITLFFKIPEVLFYVPITP